MFVGPTKIFTVGLSLQGWVLRASYSTQLVASVIAPRYPAGPPSQLDPLTDKRSDMRASDLREWILLAGKDVEMQVSRQRRNTGTEDYI